MNIRFLLSCMLLGMCASADYAKVNGPTIFNKLSDVETYAASHAKMFGEGPSIDNSDWESPEYHSHINKLVPNWFWLKVEKLGFTRDAWSASHFKRLLQAVVNRRMYEGFQGRFVQKFEPSPATNFIIFSEIDGEFHSFVRDLRSLITDKYLDESFKIIKSDCYIVIDGDAVVKGPYLLEVFTLILRLMYMNPEKVIYIIGELEDKEHWQDYGLKEELVKRAAHLSNGKIPLGDLVQKFFNTLPLAVYLIGGRTDKILNVVRISSYGIDEKALSEKNFAAALADPAKKRFSITEKSKSDISVDVRAIIRRDLLLQQQPRKTEGLVQYGKQEGATSWAVLSGPTGTYQALRDFYCDAYVILTTYQSLQDWTLTLYSQDLRLKTGIKPVKVVNLLSGDELSEPKIQANVVQGLQEKLKKTVGEIGEIQKELAEVTPLIGTAPALVKAAVPITPMVTPTPVPPAPIVQPAPTPEIKTTPVVIVPAPEIKPVPAIELAPAEKPVEAKPIAEVKPVPSTPAPAALPQVSGPSVSEKMTQEVGASVAAKPSEEEKWAVPPTGDIIIAGTFDQSHDMPEQSKSYINGIELAFGQANATGGINGRKIALQAKDDEGNADIAYENVLALRELYKTDLITGPMGWATMKGKPPKEHIFDLIKKGEILSMFPYMSTPEIRKPTVKNVINFMVGTLQTFFPMFRYAFENMNVRKPAIVYPTEISDESVKIMMKGAHITDYIPKQFSSESVDFSKLMEEINKENPDLIVFLTYPTPAINFMRQMKTKIHDKVIMIDASLVGVFFTHFLSEKVSRFVIGSAVPDPERVEATVSVKNQKEPLKLEIIENYKKIAKEKGVIPDSISLMGYISGKLMVDILRKVQGVITKEKVMAAAASMKDFEMGGLPLSFDPVRHQFAKYTFLLTNSENWFAIDVSKFPYFEEFLSTKDIEIKRKLDVGTKPPEKLKN